MGFLGGLANFAQNAGPTAGAVAQAEAQGSAQRNQQAIQLLMLSRQQRQMEIENALKQSQGVEAQAHAGLYQNEANPQFKGIQAGYEAQAQQPFKLQQLQAELNNRLIELKQSGANEMQIAAARIAGEKDIANAQIGAAASRQQNQQGFEQGQQQRQQQFQTGQQQRQQQFQTGQTQQGYENKLGEINAQGSNSITTSIGRKLGLLNTPPTPQQSDWDSAAQHIKTTQPDVDPTTILGEHP